MPKLIQGKDLTPNQVRQVKAAFVYRLTIENNYPLRNPCGARIPAISDSQWLEEHAFYIKNNGDLADKPHHCEPFYLAEEKL